MQVGERVTPDGHVHPSDLLVVYSRHGPYVVARSATGKRSRAAAEHVGYHNQGECSRSSGEGLQPEKPVDHETEVGLGIVSAVGENPETPVERLASDPDEAEIVRKNDIGVKHADAEISGVVVIRFGPVENGAPETVVRPQVGQHDAVAAPGGGIAEEAAGPAAPYPVVHNVNLRPYRNRVAERQLRGKSQCRIHEENLVVGIFRAHPLRLSVGQGVHESGVRQITRAGPHVARKTAQRKVYRERRNRHAENREKYN